MRDPEKKKDRKCVRKRERAFRERKRERSGKERERETSERGRVTVLTMVL